jgi:hypothetical protein
MRPACSKASSGTDFSVRNASVRGRRITVWATTPYAMVARSDAVAVEAQSDRDGEGGDVEVFGARDFVELERVADDGDPDARDDLVGLGGRTCGIRGRSGRCVRLGSQKEKR